MRFVACLKMRLCDRQFHIGPIADVFLSKALSLGVDKLRS
jgi:hypothetical protein